MQSDQPALNSISTVKASVLGRINGRLFFDIAEDFPEVHDLLTYEINKKYLYLYLRTVNLLKNGVESLLSGKGELPLDVLE